MLCITKQTTLQRLYIRQFSPASSDIFIGETSSEKVLLTTCTCDIGENFPLRKISVYAVCEVFTRHKNKIFCHWHALEKLVKSAADEHFYILNITLYYAYICPSVRVRAGGYWKRANPGAESSDSLQSCTTTRGSLTWPATALAPD